MKLLDFPTVGSRTMPRNISASRVHAKPKKFYPIERERAPYRAMGEKDARVKGWSGNVVHVS